MRILFASSFLGVLLGCFSAFASTLTALQNLSFGTLVPLVRGGSVVVSLNGTLTTNGVVSIAPTGISYSNGIMQYRATGLSGVLDIQFTPQIPSSVLLTNTVAGGGSVTITNFTYTPNLTVSLLSPTRNFSIGGTMTFTGASQPGTYTGSAQISVPSLLGGIIPGAPATSLPITLTLWRSLNATEQIPLHFGMIEVIGSTSTVRVTPQTGQRSVVSGSGVNLVSTTPMPTAGRFSITGQANAPVSVSLPASAVLSSAGGNMNITNFSRYPSSATLTLDATGNALFYVGADVTVNTMQPSGSYSGTYNITINY